MISASRTSRRRESAVYPIARDRKAHGRYLSGAMTDRRFNDDEVAAIFARATDAQHTGQRQSSSGEGLTLAELQEIGREVGIAPELITQAATSLEKSGSPT